MHSRARYVHSAKPDITDRSKSIHEQNPKQNSDQKPKTQKSRRDLTTGGDTPNIDACSFSFSLSTLAWLIPSMFSPNMRKISGVALMADLIHDTEMMERKNA